MISKEERAELREELSNANLGFPLPWRLGEYADIVDDDGDAVADCMVENSFTGSSAERYIVAAANAAPKLLDAIDAADERIKVLESENRRALELIDVGLAETAKWQGHLERTEDRLNARIAELEAAAQWRPIEEAPKDGKDWFIVARAGTPLRGPAYWFHGHWCQGNNAELHFTPTHFCELPDAPALPEGGA